MIGAPWLESPLRAMCRAASEMLEASTARKAEIGAVHLVVDGCAPAQREHFHARDRRFRLRKIFAFRPRHIGDRAQHEDCRERQFHRQRGKSERAARSA